MEFNIVHIIKSINTINEMLSDRNYDDSIKPLKKNEIKYLEKHDKLEFLIDSNNKKIFIKYLLCKLRPTYVKNILDEIISRSDVDNSNTEIMIILGELPGISVEKIVNKFMVNNKYFIQLFLLKNLVFNITKHISVPKHIILNKSEVINFLKEYNIINKNQLPIIQITDPIAKYYSMKTGDICKIIRYSETCGNYISYRICK